MSSVISVMWYIMYIYIYIYIYYACGYIYMYIYILYIYQIINNCNSLTVLNM